MSFVQQQLSEMNVFSTVNLKYVPRDTTALNDTLDIEITGILDKPYDGEFTTKVTSKSNGQIGPGLSFSMSKRNAFRGAEKLKFEVHGSYEWQTNSTVQGHSSVINSYEYGTSLSLDYPRLIFPGARKFSRRAKTSTSFVLDSLMFQKCFRDIKILRCCDLNILIRSLCQSNLCPCLLLYYHGIICNFAHIFLTNAVMSLTYQ